eukprot:CAMPEP_0114529280 /NCGR_PEP_ID=MMETSP0109-20121206/24739_1 /TAXON_ID=29199 /ORGANISM="Chlorarachnion reptans, Strain CCCM449" /LENGTH=505 /DNA_ID=CAMNT_0001711649 /DNA_START=215 /DNA_END=1732 /DNA_ORIENTATION=-
MPNARNRKAMKKMREAKRAKLAAEQAGAKGQEKRDSTKTTPKQPPFEKAGAVLAKSAKELLQTSRLSDRKEAFEKSKPFKHLLVQNFLDEDYALLLKDELMHEEFYQKSNDLYDFTQTKDLNDCSKPFIKRFKDILQVTRAELEAISGFKLKESVDIFGAIYTETGKLLCHDDRMPGRKIAYILYLTPEGWSKEKDGGALDLFETDGKLMPTGVAKTIVPEFNSLVFFEVSKVSFHQVSEVISKRARVSLSGWFYGDTIDSIEEIKWPEPDFKICTEAADKIEDWVGRTYRKPNMIKKIRQAFLEESSIDLRNFLRKDKFESLSSALYKLTRWRHVGPFHKMNYLAWNDSANPGMDEGECKEAETIVEGFRKFMCSEQLRGLLGELTGITLKGVAIQIRKFGEGHYTLAHDDEPFMKEEGLDVVLCCTNPAHVWDLKTGGSMHYIDGEEELLTIEASSNTLSLVYRAEPGTSRFVKYVNAKAPAPRIDIACTFRCEEDEEEDDNP